ncbi:type VII secretion integral membrane protein EccD [Nocardiopsis sp. L17-MgMaSL7]|uniref:type VII secretion integral membrane protein EccD n=1 Tax=Nocardiopsis sp. L17-MgMaSL7 TaxID=1938893 RepID=UPI000D70BC0F|nr:type VII secretion integral membrane protein EccD [Nocardiopsis sp. L17-MgMaSL7]PWV45509.1 type VII secretion integral membrane protein EccD [Nocardiopsis sp. L17-MgMaSL7]
MSGYCRVTVTGPTKWADLALPGTVPVATLMPRIIEVCVPEDGGTDPGAWTLSTIDGDPIHADTPLESAGVYDGDVLTLHPRGAPARRQNVDDVRGAVEDEVDEHAWIWNPTTTLSFGLVVSALGPLLMLLLLMWLRPSPGHLAVGALGTMYTLAFMVFAARRPLPVVAHLLFSTACVWGAVTALLVGGLLSGSDPLVRGAFALCGALLVAIVGWALDRTGLAYIAGLAVLTLGAGVLVAVGIFVEPVQGVRSMALALVLCVGVLPRSAMVMGGLSGLDYEVGRSGQVSTGRFEETFDNSDRLLLGIITGAGVSSGLVTVLLAYYAQTLPDLLLCGLMAVLLLLRSRLFDRIRHVLPLRISGVIGIGATGVAAIGTYPVLGPWLPFAVLVGGVVLGILSGVRLTDVPRASLRRLLNWTEIVVVIAMLPVFAWAMGLFQFVGERTGTF